MTYKEDLIIEKKYLNLVNMFIYNVGKDMHGMITGIDLLFLINGASIEFTAQYDNINTDHHVFLNDFISGKMKFVFLKGSELESGLIKELQDEQFANIKDIFGKEFTNDMVMWIDEQDRKTALSKQEHRQKKYIGTQLVNLDGFAKEVIYDSYSMFHAFCLYAKGIIDEKQMLYAMVNILAAEKCIGRDIILKDMHEIFLSEARKSTEENEVSENNAT